MCQNKVERREKWNESAGAVHVRKEVPYVQTGLPVMDEQRRRGVSSHLSFDDEA